MNVARIYKTFAETVKNVFVVENAEILQLLRQQRKTMNATATTVAYTYPVGYTRASFKRRFLYVRDGHRQPIVHH